MVLKDTEIFSSPVHRINIFMLTSRRLTPEDKIKFQELVMARPEIDLYDDYLQFGQSKINEYLDPDLMRNMVDEHLEGRENRRLLIWSLLSLEKWCETFAHSG